MHAPAQVLPNIVNLVDSHTGGEPTRLVVSGGPLLSGRLQQQVECLRRDHDHLRRMVLSEPRGAEHMVGALLCPSPDPRCITGVIFFNNVGYLGMCGHGLMGVMVSLAHLGRIDLGTHFIDTPVGVVQATLDSRNTVTIRNVASWRYAHEVRVADDVIGVVTGDVAWGSHELKPVVSNSKCLLKLELRGDGLGRSLLPPPASASGAAGSSDAVGWSALWSITVGITTNDVRTRGRTTAR